MAGELFFLFFDVQHGHATYIKTPNGLHWFIDLGQGSIQDTDETFSPLLHMHDEYGVDSLASLVLTHPHHDHIADIENLPVAPPQALAAPDHLTDDEVRKGQKPGEDMEPVEAYLSLVKRFNHPVKQAKNPRLPVNNGGVRVRRFRPHERARSNLNNHSIVTVLEYAGTKVLIPGDNEAPSWRELLEDPDFVAAITGTDILLAAHHGREAGYCADIFEYFKPCLTIVSDGPGSDTSAVAKYYHHSTGWDVRSRSTREVEERYVVTTRSDMAVTVRLTEKDDGEYMREVTVA